MYSSLYTTLYMHGYTSTRAHKEAFLWLLDQDNVFSILSIRSYTYLCMSKTHSFSNQVYESVPLSFKGTVGLITLKNKLLEKSVNLGNNPVEDTLVLICLPQTHATGPQD